MTPVILETPYAGDVALHLRYLRSCMRDCLLRGEAPYASHHLYTAPGVLRDEVPSERGLGIVAGFAWRALVVRTVFYVDLGWSSGMLLGRNATLAAAQPYEVRVLGADWAVEHAEHACAGAALGDWLRSFGG